MKMEPAIDTSFAISIANKFLEALSEKEITQGTLYFGLYHIIAGVIKNKADQNLWDVVGDIYVKYRQTGGRDDKDPNQLEFDLEQN